MKTINFFGCLIATATAFSAAACTTETTTSDDAPEATLDGLDEQTEGSSYGGWTQSQNGSACSDTGTGFFNHYLTRTSGPLTRGGGGCAVVLRPYSLCFVDIECSLEAGLYGPEAHGYCYQQKCYVRPGSQSNFCTLGPNRPSGYFSKNGSGWNDVTHVLGCMTKAAGPSYDCGGTDTSLYMRNMVPITKYSSCGS